MTKRRLAIIGAGGHGKVLADVAERNGYDEIVFLDDDQNIRECRGLPVLGKISDVETIDADVVVAVGSSAIRKRIQETVPSERLATLIHPSAVVAKDVILGSGTVVLAGVVINPGTKIGKGCIVNTCSSIDHDCNVGDYVHIAVGAHLCGTVAVGDGTWIGAGAIVVNNLSICSNSIIGAGAVVVRDVEITGTYVGVPAKPLK